MRPMSRLATAVVCLTQIWTAAWAQLALDGPVTEGAVLQRGVPITLSGRATPGATVTVTLGQTRVQSLSAPDGRWSATLPAQATSAEPRELNIRTTEAELEIGDIRIGDVWIVAGQSNAAWPTQQDHLDNGRLRRAPLREGLRLYRQPPNCAKAPAPAAGEWRLSDWEGAKNFSALGYHFGAALADAAPTVPVGIIQAARGGSPLDAWLPPDALAVAPDALRRRQVRVEADRAARAAYPARVRAWLERHGLNPQTAPPPPSFDAGDWVHVPGCYWDGMLESLADTPVAGVLWYQGETDATRGNTNYAGHLEAFLQVVRARWGGALPVVVIGLPPYAGQARTPVIRAAQREVASADPHTYFVPAEAPDHDVLELHPRNKRDPALRAAQALGLIDDSPPDSLPRSVR